MLSVYEHVRDELLKLLNGMGGLQSLSDMGEWKSLYGKWLSAANMGGNLTSVFKFTRIVSFSGEQFGEWTLEIGGGPGVGKSLWARLSGYKQPAWGKIEGET